MPRLGSTQSKLRVYELLLQINTGFDTIDRALATLNKPERSTTRNSRTAALFRQKLEPPSPPTSRALSKLQETHEAGRLVSTQAHPGTKTRCRLRFRVAF